MPQRACYALATPGPSGAPGAWRVELRRGPNDVPAAVAAFDGGMRAAGPDFVELIVRELRTGRPYLGPVLRATAGLDAGAVPAAVRRFLAEHP